MQVVQETETIQCAIQLRPFRAQDGRYGPPEKEETVVEEAITINGQRLESARSGRNSYKIDELSIPKRLPQMW